MFGKGILNDGKESSEKGSTIVSVNGFHRSRYIGFFRLTLIALENSQPEISEDADRQS